MTLREMLTAKAEELAAPKIGLPGEDYREWVHTHYRESTNPDAIAAGDAWLNSGTSFIWRVGVLALTDSNKCDFAHVFIGYEREPGKLQYIGYLEFVEGENDDMGRCLERAMTLLDVMHPAFQFDRER